MPDCCNREPIYAALEGPKGAGKSTVLGIVRRALHERGIRIASLNPTARGFVLHPLELLYRGFAVDPLAERVYAYRSNRQASLLQSRHVDWDVLLGDRSFITTLATRWHRTEVVGERAHFDRCRKLEWAVPLPSDVIYLDVPVETLRRRVESRGRRYGVRDEQVERLAAAREAYSAIRHSRLPELVAITWHLVDGTKPVEQVAADVADLVGRLMRRNPASDRVEVGRSEKNSASSPPQVTLRTV